MKFFFKLYNISLELFKAKLDRLTITIIFTDYFLFKYVQITSNTPPPMERALSDTVKQ